MNASNSSVSGRRTRRLLAIIALGAGLLAFPLSRLAAAAFRVTPVTGGTDPVTSADQQSETAYNVSQLGGGTRVETVAYNDKTGESPTFLTYSPTRTIFRARP